MARYEKFTGVLSCVILFVLLFWLSVGVGGLNCLNGTVDSNKELNG
jgi:hypothetical protein